MLRHGRELADDVEFALWAERLPELMERIEVEVTHKNVALALVSRTDWARYFRGTSTRMFVRKQMFRIARFLAGR